MPELATMIESGDDTLKYISLFKELIPNDITTGVLVCTHYGIVKDEFKQMFPQIKTWVLQEEIIPEKFKSYFKEKVEIIISLPPSEKDFKFKYFFTKSICFLLFLDWSYASIISLEKGIINFSVK